MRRNAPKPAQAGLMQMTINKLLEKYGYKTISLAMQHAARYIPADAQHAGMFHGLQEMAMDLESALRDYSESNRIEK